MDYGRLTSSKAQKGSIANWLNYNEIDAEGILRDAQTHIFSHLRVREMRSSAPVTIALAASTASLPTGFLDPIYLGYLTGEGEIELREPKQIESNRPYDDAGTLQSGTPCEYAVFDELLQFDVKSDAARSARMLYYKQPTFLAPDNATNFLTTRHSHLLRAALMMQGENFRQNTTEFQRWAAQVTAHIDRINVADDLGR
jgi:hypothetical protein